MTHDISIEVLDYLCTKKPLNDHVAPESMSLQVLAKLVIGKQQPRAALLLRDMEKEGLIISFRSHTPQSMKKSSRRVKCFQITEKGRKRLNDS